MRVGVIDYGVGNLGSVMRALEELRVTSQLVTQVKDLADTDSFILPGVGNFSDCAKLLRNGGWVEPLTLEVLSKNKPILGICLGMQLLATSSTEGVDTDENVGTLGLNFIQGQVKSLRTLGCRLRVPHVGWNEVVCNSESRGIFEGIPNKTDFYFVHSYAFVAESADNVLATTMYDVPVTAAIRSGHIWGTQFHPEKSSRAGFKLLRNFIENPRC
jgi:glutamine amidotransferase